MNDVAIRVEGVNKTFWIPHEKISSVRGAFVNMFRKSTYEEFNALNDVSFDVKKGEFFGIIGRNGSGKSTLLKILAGIYQADRGKVHINGLISPFLELGIGFNPELSGRDNIYLNATVLGLTKKQIDEKFDEIVAFSELERFIDQKLKNYSSGMHVRLAFSVAIHANREILLMDEVLAVGDSNFQSKCLDEFNKYRDLGKTVILVSHNISTIQRYCDRAILLRNGKIIKIGKAEDVGNAYVNENMDDEEKRMREDEKQKIIQAEEKLNNLKGKELEAEKKRIELEIAKQEEERKNKVAKITRVEFLDKDGIEKRVFGAGDDLSVRVHFDIHKMRNEFNFGLALYNQEGNYIFGINTIMDSLNTRKFVENKYFQLDFKNISLNRSSYYVLVGIAGTNFNSPFDVLPKSKYFKIVSKSKNEGVVNLDYSWK